MNGTRPGDPAQAPVEGAAHATNGARPLRVMSWNFLEGGLGCPDEKGRRAPNPERRAAAQALVARLNPDVLVINEALFGEGRGVQHEDYGRLFGFEHQFARAYDDACVWGNAILSHRPMLDRSHQMIHRAGPQNRGMMAVRLATDDGPLWVATYHPHPWRRPDKRAEDVAEFLHDLNGPALLTGDLNAIHPDDAVEVEVLVRAHERFQSPEQARRSVERFQQAGVYLFHDTLPRLGWRPAPMVPLATMPTALVRVGEDSGMRIDHIVVNDRIRVHTAWVEQAAEADRASDHYPVLAEVSIRV